MKKVLIVAYHFPPDAAVGALRVAKFARYLPTYGWEPYVLTVREKYYPVLDESRLDHNVISSRKVFRTGMLTHPSVVYRRLKAAYYRPITQIENVSGETCRQAEGLGSVFRRMTRRAGSLLSLPDERLGWLPIATAKAIQLLRRFKIDCIYTSGPPHTVHLIGLVIKKIAGVRWIADFRDPWVLCWTNEQTMAERVGRWMERRVMENADAVVTTTKRMTEGFRGAYSSVVRPGKFVTISNGYDSEDFASVKPHPNGKFTIMYLGTFYLTRTPEPLLKAVSELVAERKMELDEVEVQFIGECECANGRRVCDMVDSLGLAGVVKVMAPVNYSQALAHMVGSDLLLLLAPEQPHMIPAKAFEYLASGTDVLALTGDGATADLMRSFKRGVVASPNDIRGIKEAIMQSYTKWRMESSGGREALAEDVRMYERRVLTRGLALILEGRTPPDDPSPSIQ